MNHKTNYMSFKKNFILDFDNTFVDSNPAHVRWMNIHYEMESKASDYINNPSLELVVKKYRPELKVSREQVYEDSFQFFLNSKKIHEDIKPFNGAVEVIVELSKKYKIWFATARQKRGEGVIRHVIDKHIPGCVAGIHCVWNLIAPGVYNERPKKNFIVGGLTGDTVAFVDDLPKEVIAVQDHVQSFLFDPFNLHQNNENVINRVRNWNQLGDILL